MEIITNGNERILVASKGYTLQSVTDGLIIGPRIYLGKKDSEIHYHEIPLTSNESDNDEE